MQDLEAKMRNKKKQEEKEALEGKGKKEDRRADLPGGVTFVDRHREAAVSSEADIKKELRVSNKAKVVNLKCRCRLPNRSRV